MHFIQRVSRKQNELLHSTTYTFTAITQPSDFELFVFKAMDKVCQMMYTKNMKYKQSRKH